MIKLFSTTGWVAAAVAVAMLAASGEVNAQSGYRSGGPWNGGRNSTRGSAGTMPGGGRAPTGSMARGGIPGGNRGSANPMAANGRSSSSGMSRGGMPGSGRGSLGGSRGPANGSGRGPGGIAGSGRGSNGTMPGGGRGATGGRGPNGGTAGKTQTPKGGKQYAGSAGGGRAPGGGFQPGGGGRGNTGGMAGAGRVPNGANGGKTSVPPGGFKYAGSAGGGRAPGGGSAPGGGFQPGGGFNPGGAMPAGGAPPGGGGPFGGYGRAPMNGALAASGATAGAIGRSTYSSGGNPGGRALAYSGSAPSGPNDRDRRDDVEPGSVGNAPSWGAEGWNDAWNWHHHRNHHGYWNGGIWYPPTVIMHNQAPAYMQLTQPIAPGSKWLGVTFEPYGGGGAYITGVYEGSPAQAAGIQVGDVIAYVNGADATHLPSVVQQSDGYVEMQVLSGQSGEFQQAQINLVMN